MLYERETLKTPAGAFEAVQESIRAHGFGLLHHYDFRRTLAEKGHALPTNAWCSRSAIRPRPRGCWGWT